MSRLPLLAFVLILALLPRAASAADCQFVLGFKEYRDSYNHAYIGECLENERTTSYGATQRTTKGTLHWYRDGNYIDFVPNVAPSPTPEPTPILEPMPEPQQESIACRDGELLRALVIRDMRERDTTSYWINLAMPKLEVIFGTYTVTCELMQALGYTITQEFEDNYRTSQKFRHAIWCIIEPHLSEEGQANMKSALSTYPGNRGNAWNDYLFSECKQEFAVTAQPTPTPEPTVVPTPTPTPAPYVDPRLESAIRVMRTTEIGEFIWGYFLHSGADATFADLPGNTYGEYSPTDHEIRVALHTQHDLPFVVAIFVHEITHAWISAHGEEEHTGAEGCFDEETLAFKLEAKWWLEYYGRGGRSGWHRENGILFMYLDGTLGDWVRSHEGYQEQCAA